MFTLEKARESEYPVPSLRVAFKNSGLLNKIDKPNAVLERKIQSNPINITLPGKQAIPQFYEHKIKPLKYEFY